MANINFHSVRIVPHDYYITFKEKRYSEYCTNMSTIHLFQIMLFCTLYTIFDYSVSLCSITCHKLHF